MCPSLATFDAFVQSTGEKIVSGPNDIINDAAKNTYMIRRMNKGSDASMVVQGGAELTERIMLSDSGTAEFYHPNDDMDIQNVDNLKSIRAPWRFLADHYGYTEEEVNLNSGDPQVYYKSLLKSKRQACETSIWNKKESSLWAPPNAALMSGADGKHPYSFPTLVTPNGLAPAGFSDILTVNPALEQGWRNQTEQYDPANVRDENNGLVRAMDRMWHKCRFIAPRSSSEYFESDMLQKMVIATNLDGVTLIQTLTRDANDRLIPANNLGWTAGNVTYAGLPIEYCSDLDTTLINGGAPIASNEPWFYYLNLNYLFLIFHSGNYMREKAPMPVSARQPFSRVVWKNSYYQMFVRSRRRQGLITPTG